MSEQKAEDESVRERCQECFNRAAARTSQAAGSPLAFLGALGSVVIWFIVACFTGFSDSVQLIINTGTTIVTFLLVFLIQNSQNRDARAFHLKLDELIRVQAQAHNEMIDLERAPERVVREVEGRMQSAAHRPPSSEAGSAESLDGSLSTGK